MIKLVSLEVDGFKNLKIHNLEFPPEGNILVTGRNESGKSSLFEAIFFALTSKLLVKKAGGFIDAIAFDKNAAVVDLIFKKDGISARIKKQVFKTGTGTSVEIEFWKKYETGNERPISGNRKKIDPKIEEFLGFDDQILLNSSFVKQKGLEGFMEHSKQDRIKILNKLLNMEKISIIRDLYKKEIKNKEIIEEYYEKLLGIERNTLEIEKINKSIENENEIFKSFEKNNMLLTKIESLRLEFLRLNEESQETLKLIENEAHEHETLEEKQKDLEKYQELMKERISIKSKIQIDNKELENLQNSLNNLLKDLNEFNTKIEEIKKKEVRLEESKKILSQSEEKVQSFGKWRKKLKAHKEIEEEIKRIQIQLQAYKVSIEKNTHECNRLESDIRMQINESIKEIESNVLLCKDIESNLEEKSKKYDLATLKTNKYKNIKEELNKLKFQLKEKEKEEIVAKQKLEDSKKVFGRLTSSEATLNLKETELKELQEKFTSLKHEEKLSIKSKKLEEINNSKTANILELTQINKKLAEDNVKLKPLKKIKEKSEGNENQLGTHSQFKKFLPIFIILSILGVLLSFFNLLFLIFTAVGVILAIYFGVLKKGSITEFSKYSEQYLTELENRISENLKLKKNVEEDLKLLNNKAINLENELSPKSHNKLQEDIVKEIGLTQTKIIQIEEQIRSVKNIGQDEVNSFKEADISELEHNCQNLEKEISSIKNEIQTLDNQTQGTEMDSTTREPPISNQPDKIKDDIRKLENDLNNLNKRSKVICEGLGIQYEFNEIKSSNLDLIINNEIKKNQMFLESVKNWSDWDNFHSNFQKFPLIQKQLENLKSKYDISIEEKEILEDLVSKINENENNLNTLRKNLPERYQSNTQDFDNDFTDYTSDKAKLEKEMKDLEKFLSENRIEDINNKKNYCEFKIKEFETSRVNTENLIESSQKRLKEIETSIPEQYQESQDKLAKELSNDFKRINNKITSLKTSDEANWNNYLKDIQDFINKYEIKYDSPSRDNVNHYLQELSIKYTNYSNDLINNIKKIYPSFSDRSAEDNLKTLVNEKHNKIGALKKDIKAYKEYVQVIEGNRKTSKILGKSQIDGKDLSEKYENASHDRKIYETAINLLEEGQGSIISKVLPRTEENLTKILPILTADRYKDAHITNDYQINVFDSKKGDYVERNLFSGGTNDQIALAIRLSFAMVTMPQNELNESFIFLDEPLGFFDDDRKNALIDFLTHGSIADQFAQRIVISNFLDIKKYFDFVIELENGVIINQYSTGTLDSKQIELLYETLEESEIVTIDHINIEEEDGYYEETLKVNNVSDVPFKNVQISIPEVNIMITPKNLYNVKPEHGKNITIGFNQVILEGKDLYFDIVVKYQENGVESYKNQKIPYVPQLK